MHRSADNIVLDHSPCEKMLTHDAGTDRQTEVMEASTV